MKSISHLPEEKEYSSVWWYASETMPGIRVAVKQISLQQRIELIYRVRELTLKHEFLKAGEISDPLDAALAELLVAKLYLEWGIECVEGLSIDGTQATSASLIASGPESLSAEIVSAILVSQEQCSGEDKNEEQKL